MDDEILQEFLAESWENLAQLDTEIVELEKQPDNEDLLASIFRTIHTIKGTCGFLGLTGLGGIAHSAENVLGQMRDRVLEPTPNAISLVLEAVDVIKDLLNGLEATSEEPKLDSSELISKLDAMATAAEQGASEPEPATSPAADVGTPVEETAESVPESPAEVASPVEETTAVNQTGDLQSETEADPNSPESPKEIAEMEKDIIESASDSEDAPTKESGKKSVADLSIRVNVNVLDSLMNLVGELVLTRNQLLQLARGDEESKYAAPISHLNRVTTDLQEGVMKTRMQPIGNAWNKLPRLVRDLSQVTGHQIDLEMSGAETELDRTVLDAIKDPLTHMVRNSADHGIESPDVRRAAGKSETGKVKLNAFHEGGHVIITIEDDGAGINTEKVLQKAIRSGLLSEAAADKLSPNEVLALIFRAGFSTAETVSSVSGRGVGMDVVKTAIERIGGTVDLSSTQGKGTAVRIKIPLTLAIISALVVESGGESFAIPQLGVVELVRLAAEDRNKIERIHDNQVFRLRDRLLPLVYLNSALELDAEPTDEETDINIVVVQVGEEQFGLIVSEVFDTEEIVVKPVGRLLKEISIYQGTTILGDGRVIMILDVAGIAAEFGGLSSNADESDHSEENDIERGDDVTSLLLFDAGGGTTMSVPLSLVARLEEFPREMIESSGDSLVVQYRDDLLPLQPISNHISGDDAPDPQPVIVFSEGNNSMGLMVNEIQDIAEERMIIRMQSQRPGVLGTAIINGNATDVIDTHHYVCTLNPDWFSRNDVQNSRRVLIADDSVFFRQLLTTALETSSYQVTVCNSAVDAVEVIERGAKFDVIISDIDMPMMDGFEFAEWLRSRTDTQNTPLIALSAMGASTHEARALQAGFDQYLRKFNSQQLASAIEELSSRARLTTGASA